LPGWPDVGRADDHRLLEALRRGDAHAPAGLYDAYADRLNDYAHSLLHDPDLAADAVHDSLVIAHARVDRLKEPTRLRAWLYALTRVRCAARGGGRTPPHGMAALAPEEEPADPRLAELVHEALGELGRDERQALELSVRHGLSTAEIGAVLGVTSRQAAGHLTRARDHLENAAAAIVLARTGRAHCPDLSALVDSGVGASWQDGPLSPSLRKRLSRHISGCEVCTEGRGRHVSADPLLAMMPVTYPRLSLRRQVIDTCTSPEREETRAAVIEQVDHFDRRGFPAAGARSRGMGARRRRGSGDRRKRRATPMLLAAVIVFGGAGAATLIYSQAPESRLEAMNPLPAPQEVLTTAPDDDDELLVGPEESAGPAETTPSRTPTASPQGVVVTPPAQTAAPRPTPSLSRTPPRPPSPAALDMNCPGGLGAATGGAVTLAARNAVVEWSATASPGLTVSPKHGRLKAGASGRITLTIAEPSRPGSGVVSFRSAAGNPACRVSWSGTGTGEPSTDPPASPSPDSSGS
jgi:RNA polymerase sigma factor (sigma-70 family)